MTDTVTLGMLAPLRRARSRLGLSADADARAVKTAYRRAVAEHPPDRNPVAFQEIREAYELLSNPMERAAEILNRFVPHHPPPQLAPPEAPARAEAPLPELVLRAAIGSLPSSRARALAAACRGTPAAHQATASAGEENA